MHPPFAWARASLLHKRNESSKKKEDLTLLYSLGRSFSLGTIEPLAPHGTTLPLIFTAFERNDRSEQLGNNAKELLQHTIEGEGCEVRVVRCGLTWFLLTGGTVHNWLAESGCMIAGQHVRPSPSEDVRSAGDTYKKKYYYVTFRGAHPEPALIGSSSPHNYPPQHLRQ